MRQPHRSECPQCAESAPCEEELCRENEDHLGTIECGCAEIADARQKPGNKNKITGQIFVRKLNDGQVAPDGSNRRIIGVVGILAIPRDCPLLGEHQYNIVGTPDGMIFNVLPLGKNLTKTAKGASFSDLVSAKIWKI